MQEEYFYNHNFVFSSPYIALMCNNNQLSVYSEGYNVISGNVFDYSEGSQSVGGANADISQACFGVFTSGGKHHKDACRHVMSQQCGIDLDSKCKESGLYDYINQNPPSKAVLPSVCKFTENDNGEQDNFNCFKFVAKHFIGGTLSIKPGSFLSYSLYAQIEENGGEIPFPEYYAEPEMIAKYPIQFTIEKAPNEFFYVEGNVNNQFTSYQLLNKEVDTTGSLQFNTAHIPNLPQFALSILILFLL